MHVCVHVCADVHHIKEEQNQLSVMFFGAMQATEGLVRLEQGSSLKRQAGRRLLTG